MTAASVATDRPLGRGDARTLVLAALCGVLEFHDFAILVFCTSVIAQLFFRRTRPMGCASCRRSTCSQPTITRARLAHPDSAFRPRRRDDAYRHAVYRSIADVRVAAAV